MPQPTSAPPAGPAAAPDRLSVLLDAVGRLASQQQALLTALAPAARPPAMPPPAPPPLASAGVSLDDVRAVVTDLLGRHRVSDARAAYVREHLTDLPDAYRRLVPETDDAAALAAAEQTVRRQFRDDLRAAGRSAGEPAAAVGGDRPGGLSPAAAVDYATLSPLRQIEVGLRGAGDRGRAATVRPSGRTPAADEPADADAGAESDALDELFVGAD